MQASRRSQTGLPALGSVMIAPARGSTAFGADALVRLERVSGAQPFLGGRYVAFDRTLRTRTTGF